MGCSLTMSTACVVLQGVQTHLWRLILGSDSPFVSAEGMSLHQQSNSS